MDIHRDANNAGVHGDANDIVGVTLGDANDIVGVTLGDANDIVGVTLGVHLGVLALALVTAFVTHNVYARARLSLFHIPRGAGFVIYVIARLFVAALQGVVRACMLPAVEDAIRDAAVALFFADSGLVLVWIALFVLLGWSAAPAFVGVLQLGVHIALFALATYASGAADNDDLTAAVFSLVASIAILTILLGEQIDYAIQAAAQVCESSGNKPVAQP